MLHFNRGTLHHTVSPVVVQQVRVWIQQRPLVLTEFLRLLKGHGSVRRGHVGQVMCLLVSYAASSLRFLIGSAAGFCLH